MTQLKKRTLISVLLCVLIILFFLFLVILVSGAVRLSGFTKNLSHIFFIIDFIYLQTPLTRFYLIYQSFYTLWGSLSIATNLK